MQVFKNFTKMSKLSRKYHVYTQTKDRAKFFYIIKKGQVQIEYSQEILGEAMIH